MRIAIPDSLQTILGVPWNAIFTSCIHDVLDRASATDWRLVDPVFSDQRIPVDPRSRTQLHLFRLYGCVTRDIDIEQPPTNQIELLQRHAVASAMLSRLPELVTPRGVFVIDALELDDWMKLDVLAEHVARLGKGQTHIFGASDEIRAAGHLPLLARMGKLAFHRETLGQVIQQAVTSGLLLTDARTRDWREGVELTLRSGRTHIFAPPEWRRLTGGLTVLSDANCHKADDFVTKEEKYHAFREFLYGFHATPNWSGFCHGFAFRRDAFTPLIEAVRQSLASLRLHERPVLMCGQSGVGKSVALADLAVQMRSERWPVLYFGRNYADVDYGVIETVCSQIEQLENTSTLVVWDSMNDAQTYSSLAGHLASRGRKVVVVGSCYERHPDGQCFSFSPAMSSQEAGRFVDHLRRIDPTIVEGVTLDEVSDPNFLAWLWRLLPEARGRLRTGLLREFDIHEQRLGSTWSERAQAIQVERGTLGALLREAGISVSQSDATENITARTSAGTHASQIEKLSGLILIPARYGQDTPVDLVLRCLGREGFDTLRSALQNVPVYRWVEDDRGNHFLGARQGLEADIIVRARFTRHEEFEFIHVLLRSIRLYPDWQVPNPEVEFALRLIRAVGPDSDVRNPTSEELIGLADTLGSLLSNNANRPNPRLLFDEGHLRREALLRLKDSLAWENAAQLSDQVGCLIEQYEKAAHALTEAEVILAGSHGSQRRTRSLSFVHTEFASLYGLAQELHFRIAERHPQSQAQQLLTRALQEGFDEAVRHCKYASVYDAENAYPADVRFRVTRTRLNNDTALTPDERASLVTDLCDILEQDCWAFQAEQYERRRLELAAVLGDDMMRTKALEALSRIGSTAGEYLLAWNDMYYADHLWRPPREIDCGLDRIRNLGDRARRDLKMVRLYTRAWWQRYGDPRLFSPDAERVAAALSQEQWEHFSQWLRLRVAFEEESSPFARFQYAWALFQTGHYRESEDEFRILDRQLTAGRFRVVRLAVWADDTGMPIVCQGTIRRAVQDSDKGWVYVPQIRREISFQSTDFRDQLIRPDEPLRDFYVSFNFRGPIADPSRFYRR